MRNRLTLLVVLVVTLVACGEPEPPANTPNAPKNVTASAEHGIVTVMWTHDGENTSGYRITRSVVGDSALAPQQVTQIGEVGPSARSFADRSAEIGTTHGYLVVAFGPDGASDEATTQSAVAAEPGVTLRVGTYTNPLLTEPLLATGLFLYLTAAEIQGTVTGTLTGPEGWNDDNPLPLEVAAASLEAGFWWFGHLPAVTGTYELKLDTVTSTYASSTTLTSLDTLPLPTGVTVTSFSASTVSGAWSEHPNARSYTAALFRGPHANSELLDAFHTLDMQHSFSGLALEPDDYFFAVYAHVIDRTDPLRPQPPERFDVSLDASGLFQID